MNAMKMPASLEKIKLRPLMTLSVDVDDIRMTGGPDGAKQQIASLTGGAFWGNRLSGSVRPGGSDWLTLRGDGATLINARIVLSVASGGEIAMRYTGIRHGPDDIMKRLGRGEVVDPASYYFRIQPSFATSSPQFDWLNRVVALGIGHRLPGGPVYNIFEVL